MVNPLESWSGYMARRLSQTWLKPLALGIARIFLFSSIFFLLFLDFLTSGTISFKIVSKVFLRYIMFNVIFESYQWSMHYLKSAQFLKKA